MTARLVLLCCATIVQTMFVASRVACKNHSRSSRLASNGLVVCLPLVLAGRLVEDIFFTIDGKDAILKGALPLVLDALDLVVHA